MRTSSEVMIGPPTSKPGMVRGTDPEARITLVAVSDVVEPSVPLTVTACAGAQRADALVGGDLAALDQAGEALPEAVDDLLLAGLAHREVDDRLARVDAELLGPGDVAVDGRRLQELLGRDATPVQAGAAHLVLLHEGDVQTDGRAVQGCGIAAGATSDHREIELLSRRDHLLDRPPGRLPIEHANRGSRAGVMPRRGASSQDARCPSRPNTATSCDACWSGVGRKAIEHVSSPSAGRSWPAQACGAARLVLGPLDQAAPADHAPAPPRRADGLGARRSSARRAPARRRRSRRDPVTPTTSPPTSAVAPSGRNDATRSSSDPRPASTSQTPPATRMARPHARARAISRRVLTSAACYGPPAI